MKSNLVLLCLMGGTLGGDAALGAEEVPSVRLRMTKDRYGTNEPIGVAIVFNNPTGHPLQLLLDNSTFTHDFENGIRRVLIENANGAHAIRFDAARNVSLHPYVLATGDSPFLVEPADKSACREPATVDGEVCFDRAERASALDNQVLQDRREFRILHQMRNLESRDRFGQVAVSVGFPQVR